MISTLSSASCPAGTRLSRQTVLSVEATRKKACLVPASTITQMFGGISFEEVESIYDIHNLLDWVPFVVNNSFHTPLVVVPNIILI